jgi:hypothetical protein
MKQRDISSFFGKAPGSTAAAAVAKPAKQEKAASKQKSEQSPAKRPVSVQCCLLLLPCTHLLCLASIAMSYPSPLNVPMLDLEAQAHAEKLKRLAG